MRHSFVVGVVALVVMVLGASAAQAETAGEVPLASSPARAPEPASAPEPAKAAVPGDKKEAVRVALEAPPRRFFYTGQDYGSESQFGPLNVFTSVGLVTVGRLNNSARLRDIDLKRGFAHIGEAYSAPNRAVREAYGSWLAWTFVELVPIVGISSYPNYALHFLGEGMLTRKLEEYYQAEGLSGGWARVAAIATMVLSQHTNELVESGTVLPGDMVADIFFNALGIFAFSFDGWARLFSNDYVQLLYWPGQPVVDVRDTALFNHSENYMLRTTLGSWTRWKMAFAFGAGTIGLGVSVPIRKTDYITLGLFVSDATMPGRPYTPPPQQPIFFANEQGQLTFTGRERLPHEHAPLRLFWDRQGSLLATLDVEPSGKYLGINLYPGVVPTGPVKLGAYGIFSAGAGVAVGLTVDAISVVPGLRF